MSMKSLCLHVLVVEDDSEAMEQFLRDIPPAISRDGISVKLHSCETFERAIDLVNSSVHRFDLVVTDTYKGNARDKEVGAEGIISAYQGKRFCPLVIYSSGVKPDSIIESPFLLWADKSSEQNGKSVEECINEVLDSGIPQLSRQLHNELDGTAGKFLWTFLEKNWEKLNKPQSLGAHALERIIRRRAATQIGDFEPRADSSPLKEVAGAEYYIYPSMNTQGYLNLGDILTKKEADSELSVILTPHCLLAPQVSNPKPKADYVLVAKVIEAKGLIGEKDLAKVKDLDSTKKAKQLLKWARSPAQDVGKPAGRYWYLPAFVDIPHSFCDFMQVSSVPINEATDKYNCIATLAPPFAEALQSCFAGFYSSVGIPTISTESIESLL